MYAQNSILCQFGNLEICPNFANPYLTQFSSISGGNCIRLTVSSFDSQANQSNQSSIQQELLMPSPQVIDLTLSDDDEIQPDPIRSDQQTSTHTQATNRFRTSSSSIPTSGINRTRKILPVIQGTFTAIERAENYLHSNLSSTTLTLDKHSSTVSTTSTGLEYLTSILWRPASAHPLTTVLSQKSL